MTLDTRLVAYLPNGASQGPLPTPVSFDAALVLNDVGSLVMSYGAQAPRSDLLGQPLEVALETSADGGVTYTEPRNARFLYLQDGRDPVKDDSWGVTAPGYIRRLEKALVPITSLDANGQLQFAGKTIGFILDALFTAAQARGAMSGMSWNFTATTDSNGAAWVGTKTLGFDGGKDFLSIIQEWSDLGDIDYAMQGRQVQVWVAGSLGGDKTIVANPVTLRYGRDYTDAPYDRTWAALADTALVQGDAGKTQTVVNAGATKPWGVQETLVSAAGITDLPTLSIVGNLALSQTSGPRTQFTHGLIFDNAAFTALTDYEPGSWVYSDANAGTVTRVRVRQVTISEAQGVVQGNAVLNDRFLESDILLQRFTQRLMNNATPATGGTPTPYGNDILPPATPLGMSSSSTTYLDTVQNTLRAVIVVDWADVVTNNDGTAATDIAGYEVWRAPLGGAFSLFEHVQTSISTSSGYTPGTSWQFRTRAYDTVGNRGAFSTTVTQVAAGDTTAPGTPSAVSVVNVRLGAALLDWDATLAAGGAMPPDFWYAEIHVSATSGFTATLANTATLRETLTGPAQTIVTAMAPGTYYARVLTVDTSGNVSAQSVQTSFTLLSVQGTEIDAFTIRASNIIVGQGTAQVLANPGFESGTSEPHKPSSATLTDATANFRSGAHACQVRPTLTRAAGSYGVFVSFNGGFQDPAAALPVTPGDVLGGEVWIRDNTALGSTWAVTIRSFTAAGVIVSATTGNVVTPGAYAVSSVEHTVPAGAAYAQLCLLGAGTTANSTTILIDDAAFFVKITGDLLVNGAITSGTQNAVTISTVANPFQAGSNWGVIQFNADAGSGLWPGQIWSNYTSSRSYLSMTSPYTSLTGPSSSARLNLSTTSASDTIAELIAGTIQLSGASMILNSTNASTFDMNLTGTNVLNIRQGIGTNSFTVNLGNVGETLLRSANFSTNADTTMHVRGSTLLLDPSSTLGTVTISGGLNTNRPMIWGSGATAALHFTNAASMRISNLAGDGFSTIQASVFQVNSDARKKANQAPVVGALDNVLALKVWDYDLSEDDGGQHRKASWHHDRRRRKVPRHRGIMAQDLAKVLPDLVQDNDEDNAGPVIDLYGLTATNMAALQELAGMTRELSERVGALEG